MTEPVPTPAACWVSDWLDKHPEQVDQLIFHLSRIYGDVLVAGFGQWDKAYITEELWKQITARATGQRI